MASIDVNQLTAEQLGAAAPYAAGGDAQRAQIEAKFIRLRGEWKAQRRHEPSTMKTVMLPAYQKIIGMGQPVVPLLLRELETDVDNWFWALMAITEEDPVQESSRGDGTAMAAAWVHWGRQHGFQW